ncbi:MAG: hypothetical protein ACJAQS_001261 [Porticoccus sp.]
MNREQHANRHNQLEEMTVHNRSAYIKLEIKLDALQKLIKNNEITIDQIHCISRESKAVIKQAILNSIKCDQQLN